VARENLYPALRGVIRQLAKYLLFALKPQVTGRTV
jgi:hypothetical protein